MKRFSKYSSLFILFIFMMSGLTAYAQTVLYVDNLTGDDDNNGSIASPLATLGYALDSAENGSGAFEIRLVATGVDYVITHNATAPPFNFKRRIINKDLIIFGNSQTVKWDTETLPSGGFFPSYWEITLEAYNNTSFQNCNFDFSGVVYYSASASGIQVGTSLSSVVNHCQFINTPSNLVNSSGGATFSYCYFDNITSSSSTNFGSLVSSLSSNNVNINPFYFDASMTDAHHLLFATADNIDFGNEPDDNTCVIVPSGVTTPTLKSCDVDSIIMGSSSTIEFIAGETIICDNIDVGSGNTFNVNGTLDINSDLVINSSVDECNISSSGTLRVSDLEVNENSILDIAGALEVDNLDIAASTTHSVAGSIVVSQMLRLNENSEFTLTLGGDVMTDSLALEDGVMLTVVDNNALVVTSNVHVYDDVVVSSSTDFGNTTTTVDLTFTPYAYRYFTPPFDVLAGSLGTIESDYNAAGTSESIWLLEFSESEKAGGAANAWELITDDSKTLKAGRGYSVWGNKSNISLTGSTSYPNITDVISPQVEVSLGNPLASGVNYIGNSYSAPLVLPTFGSNPISAYYYADASSGYVCMDGDGGVVAGASFPYQDDLVIPSYGAFLVKASSTISNHFSLSDLEPSDPIVRIKSATVSEEPQYIRIALQNDNNYDDMVIQFKEDGQMSTDNYDATKIYPDGTMTRSLISSADYNNVGDYVIQTLPSYDQFLADEVISLPIILTSHTAGAYELSIDFDGMESNEIDVMLYDQVTGTTQLMDENNDLVLTLPASSTINGRYYIHLKSAGVYTDLENSHLGEYKINVQKGGFSLGLTENTVSNIQLYSVSGRQVLQVEQTDASAYYCTAHLPCGAYVLLLTSPDGIVQREKILLR